MGDENTALEMPETPSRAAKRKLNDEQKVQVKRMKEEASERRKKEREEIQRQKDEKRRQEEERRRQKEEKKRTEEQRKADEKRQREEKKREEEERKAEEKRMKEEKKREEEERKAEEKRQKEAERLQKKKEEEDRREAKRLDEERKREEKRRDEEVMEAKQQKEKNRFLSFFEKKDPPIGRENAAFDNDCPWKPFELKKGWTMAPITRRQPLTTEEKDKMLTVTVDKSVYLQNLVRLPSAKRDPMRPKLLQFRENIRPPYYGTWRKKSIKITGKNYLAKDKIFDYDVDSDEEWEDDADGEDCVSDDDDLDADEEKDEDDEKFLVAHGYLSEGEGEDDEVPNGETKEQRNARQRRKNDEWCEEHEAKTVRNKSKALVAKIYGPIFSFDDIPDEARSMKFKGIVLNYADPNEMEKN